MRRCSRGTQRTIRRDDTCWYRRRGCGDRRRIAAPPSIGGLAGIGYGPDVALVVVLEPDSHLRLAGTDGDERNADRSAVPEPAAEVGFQPGGGTDARDIGVGVRVAGKAGDVCMPVVVAGERGAIGDRRSRPDGVDRWRRRLRCGGHRRRCGGGRRRRRCVVVVSASVVVVDVLEVEVDVVTVVVGSLRPASTNEVGVAVPSPESHAAAMNNIVSANAQTRLRIVKLLCHPCVVVGRIAGDP